MADWHTASNDDFTIETNTGTLADTQAALGLPAESGDAPPEGTGTPPASETPSEERPRDPVTGQFVVKPDDEKPPEKPGEKPRSGKPRDDPTARVQQAIARQREAERRAEAAERELAAVRSRTTTPPPAPVPQASHPSATTTTNGDDPEPQLESFDNYDAYVKAQARWEARQEFHALTTAQQKAAQQQHRQREQQERAQRFKAQIETAQASDPEVLSRIRPDILNWKPLSQLDKDEIPSVENAIAEVILRSDQAMSLLRHFSDHPEESHRFASVPPEDFLREIGKLEARLEAASQPVQPGRQTMTSAKPLIKPAGGAPTASDPNEITDDLSFEEHFRRMNAKERAGRRV